MSVTADGLEKVEIHVAPDGDDRLAAPGTVAAHQSEHGPLATPQAAVALARQVRQGQDPPPAVHIVLRGGRYALDEPIVFTADDAGTPSTRRAWRVSEPERSIRLEAHPGETPVLSGGRTVTGWRETQLDGHRLFVTEADDAMQGLAGWQCQHLHVNGERRQRPRWPRDGVFHAERLLDPPNAERPWTPGVDRFIYAPGDLQPWRNLHDVELVSLHNWMESRVRIQSLDPDQRLVQLDRPTCMRMVRTHLDQLPGPYYLENVFEAIEPGEWYFDRGEGRLYYMPLAHETLDRLEVIVPVLAELVRLDGEAGPGQAVTCVHFAGLTFAHTTAAYDEQRSAHGQASHALHGAVRLRHARQCSIRQCHFTGLGSHALELEAGCRDVTIQGNRIEQIGGGGVKVWHAADDAPPKKSDPPAHACREIRVLDNGIAHCGLTFHSAVGILVGRCSGITIQHNHVHHLFYTGISVGWTWGYGEQNNAFGNVVEHNHIHDLGQGLLSDMGGIYTLGIATGTRLRFNVIHDIQSAGYGGWGIYPDEGSSNLLIEHNRVYRTSSGGFHQHYGRNNLVQHNVFAFARDAQIQQTRGEDHLTVIFRHNIVYYDQGELIAGNEGQFMEGHYSPANIRFDHNLYHRADGQTSQFLGRSLEQWQALGFDAHSLVADPGFADPAAGDFRLATDSPAHRVGFLEVDLAQVGPREAHRYRAPDCAEG
ncbi:MAG: right-handed parallel beta-helix repeat-containing protein [Phycisphaeraceae bacterium]